MTQAECFDEAAKALGSPPLEFKLDAVMARAAAMFEHMASVKKDSASATLDFSTINIVGRANKPRDFVSSDRWNRSPAFIKVGRGLWRRLSDEERAAFQRMWSRREPLLQQAEFDVADWEALVRRLG